MMAQLVGVPVVATDAEGAEGLIPEGGGTIVAGSPIRMRWRGRSALYRDAVKRRRDRERWRGPNAR